MHSMNSNGRRTRLAAALLAAVFLTGCGNGAKGRTESETTGNAQQTPAAEAVSTETASETAGAAEAAGGAAAQSPEQEESLEHGDGSDLAGSRQAGDVNRSAAFLDADYSVPDGFSDTRDDVDYGTLVKGVTYYSKTAGAQKTFNIQLPSGYDETKEYPVLYLLHGIDGGPDEWNAAPVLYGNLVADGETPPALLVFVDMWTSDLDRDSDVSESERRKIFHRFAEDLKNDLMPYIQSHYAVADGMKDTAILGLSTGGAEAVHDVVSIPGVFGYLGVLAPESDIFEGSLLKAPVLSSVTFADIAQAPLYTFFCVGEQSEEDRSNLAKFEQKFDAAGIPYAECVIKGAGHDASVWLEGFYNFAGRIFRD